MHQQQETCQMHMILQLTLIRHWDGDFVLGFLGLIKNILY